MHRKRLPLSLQIGGLFYVYKLLECVINMLLCIHMAEKLNGKKNIIIIIIIALLGFLLLSLSGNDAPENPDAQPLTNATSTPDAEVVEEPILDSEEDEAAAESEPQPLQESDDIGGDPLGTGGPVIIGYDEEKFPIYGEAPETTLAPPAQSSVEPDTSIIVAGQTLLENLDTTSDEVFEQIKPDLLELIAALEAFIEDLEAYIAYRESLQ